METKSQLESTSTLCWIGKASSVLQHQKEKDQDTVNCQSTSRNMHLHREMHTYILCKEMAQKFTALAAPPGDLSSIPGLTWHLTFTCNGRSTLRGSVGHWISRLSVFGWRNHQPSASYRTGPSTPRAPRGWEQVTTQAGPQFCQNPVPLLRDNQRQEVEYRFSVF